MMRKWSVIAIFCFVFAGGNALAEDQEKKKAQSSDAKETISETTKKEAKASESSSSKTAAVEQPAEADEAEEKLFCRTVKRVGSHRRVRVCRTAEEIREDAWDAEQYRESAFPAATPIDPGLGDGG